MYDYYPNEKEIVEALQDDLELLNFYLTVRPNIIGVTLRDKNSKLSHESIKQIVRIIKNIEEEDAKGE
ncbi:hypothetical protein [Thermoanaerobacterium sp. R66]|uniref:hypothetical protein n=1 Tax=Thermoanaerobacterium sp. R66 TaxID=2742479 RepID=UPI00238087A6|nr:hypothetical protein [Thermoanaerobacterium sp. R66]MDE4542298.1 hypothetical protein [Thermoanaerobacterium sp. R66]